MSFWGDFLKAFQFSIRHDSYPHRGEVRLNTHMLESMYVECKEEWELSDGRHDDFLSDRVHTLEFLIHESRKGYNIYLKTK